MSYPSQTTASPLFKRRYYVALALFGVTAALTELLFLGDVSPLGSAFLGLFIAFNLGLLVVPRRWLGRRLYESLPYSYFALLFPLWLVALYGIDHSTYALVGLLSIKVYLTVYYALTFLILPPRRALRFTLAVLTVFVASSLPNLVGAESDTLGVRLVPLTMILAHVMLILALNAFARLEPELRQIRRSAEQLERLAYHDFLTGIANRRQVEVLAQIALASAQRRQESFSVLMLDIDHFKRINDTYGHYVGDEILRELAARLRGELRESDIFGRWGGEEFIVITPVTAAEEGQALAERLRESLKAKPLAKVHAITVSCGVANYRPGDSLDTLVNRADTALYRAKEGGRDQVFVARLNTSASQGDSGNTSADKASARATTDPTPADSPPSRA